MIFGFGVERTESLRVLFIGLVLMMVAVPLTANVANAESIIQGGRVLSNPAP